MYYNKLYNSILSIVKIAETNLQAVLFNPFNNNKPQ